MRSSPSCDEATMATKQWWAMVVAAAIGCAQAQDRPLGLLPDDHQLEQRGARIGRIEIEVDGVFERELRARPYQTVNALHIATRTHTIAEQLLFHSGDVYTRRILEETERLLRAQRYLNAASIEPVAYHDDNTVDIVVRVHEVWTLSPGVAFGRSGGENSTRLQVEDTNFLGLGKHIALARSADVDRTAWRAAYADPNVFGSRWQLTAARAQLSDGTDGELSLTRPFYSLDTRWSARVAGAFTDSVEALYRDGDPYLEFGRQRKAVEIGGGFSRGLRDGHALRYLGGYRYQSRTFTTRTPSPASGVPEDYTLAYPWIGLEWLEDRFLETRNLEQIGRTEDMDLGRKLHLELGVAAAAFGATRSAVIANGVFTAGAELGDGQYAIGAVGFNGRRESGEIRNALLDASARYFLRHSPRRVSYVAVAATRALRLDGDEQLLLGGDNGLRGYPLRFQAGDTRALFTLEQRFYSNWQPLHLATVGACVFFDAGRIWNSSCPGNCARGWLRDVGVGLRLGNARSGLGNVVHIDLAVPFDRAVSATRQVERVQVLVQTRRSF